MSHYELFTFYDATAVFRMNVSYRYICCSGTLKPSSCLYLPLLHWTRGMRDARLGREDIWLRVPGPQNHSCWEGDLRLSLLLTGELCPFSAASRQPPVVSTCLTHVNPRTNSTVGGRGSAAAAAAACANIRGDWNMLVYCYIYILLWMLARCHRSAAV